MWIQALDILRCGLILHGTTNYQSKLLILGIYCIKVCYVNSIRALTVKPSVNN